MERKMISTYKKDFGGIEGVVSVELYDYKNVAVVIWMHDSAMEHAYTYLENNKDMFNGNVMIEKKDYGACVIKALVPIDEVNTKVKQFLDKAKEIITIAYQKNVVAIIAEQEALKCVKNWS